MSSERAAREQPRKRARDSKKPVGGPRRPARACRKSARERARAGHESAIERAEQKSEALAESAGDKVWRALRRVPYLGVAATAAGGVAIATLLGPAEIAVGVVLGYAAYLTLKKGMRPSEALRETIRVRKHG